MDPITDTDILPFVAYIDDKLEVHFELNRVVQIAEKRRWTDFLFPKTSYARIAPALIRSSRDQGNRRLIGGMSAFFCKPLQMTAVANLGLLSPEEVSDMPEAARREALARLFDRFYDFNRKLGAREIHSGPTVISPAKAARLGWDKRPVKGLRSLWLFFKQSFPFCLVRRHHNYVKTLTACPVS